MLFNLARFIQLAGDKKIYNTHDIDNQAPTCLLF